jgi:hypothetical protein
MKDGLYRTKDAARGDTPWDPGHQRKEGLMAGSFKELVAVLGSTMDDLSENRAKNQARSGKIIAMRPIAEVPSGIARRSGRIASYRYSY